MKYRMVRGGSCEDTSQYLRSTLRIWGVFEDRFWDVGFRVVIRRRTP